MASRGFYLVGAALLGGTALMLWLGARGGAAPAPGPGSEGDPDPGHDSARALGVAAAEYDPAQVPRRGDPSTLVAERSGAPTLEAAPPPRLPGPPAPPTPVPSSPDPLADARAAAQAQALVAVRDDLERRRDDLRARCWPPGSDVAATFTVEATYGADGGLLALSVPDVRGLPDVGACLMGQLGQDPPALPEPPGVDVAVAVPLAFAGAGAPPARPTPGVLTPDR